jgi:4-diphosphocytidyl-2-C-methyl-D-erythritol kinase
VIDELIVRPGAKLNLTLEVLGRRPDGFHDIVSVFQAIGLSDELVVSAASDLTIECDQADLAGDGNLALRAARLLRESAGIARGARLRLEKRVPVAAGLGGGSADAAAALVGCARVWGLDWSAERLVALAARLGSDCAFFVGPALRSTAPAADRGEWTATALASGRGERLVTLPPLSPRWALVVRPRLSRPVPADKTRRLYAALRPDDYRDGSATRALVEAMRRDEALDPTLLVNSFERAAEMVFPETARTRAAILDAGGRWARLAGSGPCLYTLFGEREVDRAKTAAARLRETGEETYLVRTGCATTG